MFRFTKQKQAACSVSGKIALDFAYKEESLEIRHPVFQLFCTV